jgi:hypothetical protein
MNLLVSESLPVDAALDRAIPWLDDLFDCFSSSSDEDELAQHEGAIVSGGGVVWYDLRLSALRQAIVGAR